LQKYNSAYTQASNIGNEVELSNVRETIQQLLRWGWKYNKNLEEQAAQLHMLTAWSQIVEVRSFHFDFSIFIFQFARASFCLSALLSLFHILKLLPTNPSSFASFIKPIFLLPANTSTFFNSSNLCHAHLQLDDIQPKWISISTITCSPSQLAPQTVTNPTIDPPFLSGFVLSFLSHVAARTCGGGHCGGVWGTMTK